MKTIKSLPIFILINIASIAIFFLPLFFSVSSTNIQDLLAPISILLITLSAVGCLLAAHSRMTSRALITLSAIACAFGVLGKLLDLPAGGSALFFVVIVSGFALGSGFGQFVGMSSIFVSALLTGGVGPWLGYQSIAMGLVGAAAGLMSPLILKNIEKQSKIGNFTFLILCGYSGLLGLLYGFIANWWSWPFLDYGKNLSFGYENSIALNMEHYINFYLRTSLWWDLWAFGTNILIMILIGRHIISALIPAREFLDPKIEFVEDSNNLDEEIYLGATS